MLPDWRKSVEDHEITDREKEKNASIANHRSEISGMVRSDLEYKLLFDGKINEGKAKARVWIPCLNTKFGVSNSIIRVENDVILPISADKNISNFEKITKSSWCGFGLSDNLSVSDKSGAAIEYDVIENGEVSVDRLTVKLDGVVAEEIRTITAEAWRKQLVSNSSDRLSLINALMRCRVSGERLHDFPWQPYWVFASAEDEQTIKKITFPLLEVIEQRYQDDYIYDDVKLGDDIYNPAHYFKIDKYRRVLLSDEIRSGNLALSEGPYGATPALTWKSLDDFANVPNRDYAGHFPESWKEIALILTDTRPIWNSDHWLLSCVSVSEPLVGMKRGIGLAKEIEGDSLSEISARTLVAKYLSRGEDFWNAFRDNFPKEFLRLVLAANFPGGILRYWNHSGDPNLNDCSMLTSEGVSSRGMDFMADGLKFPDGAIFLFPAEILIKRTSKKIGRKSV